MVEQLANTSLFTHPADMEQNELSFGVMIMGQRPLFTLSLFSSGLFSIHSRENNWL